MGAELGSAAETALKLQASAPKIAVAIRPRRPVERDELFMVVSWFMIFSPIRSTISLKQQSIARLQRPSLQ
jgi:hypothetical protein